jgi:hypothetical protein
MARFSRPFYVRYPDLRFDRDDLLDICWQAQLDGQWAHYNVANPDLGYSDLLMDAPPSIAGLFKRKVWDWCNITWVHRNGYLSPHTHNGRQTGLFLESNEYADNPTARQLKELALAARDDKPQRAPATCALFFPILGMGERSTVNTVYYDAEDPTPPDKEPINPVEMEQHSLVCPTLLRIDIWHSVNNIDQPNRFMLMLNFNDPTTLEDADRLIRDNLV